jgi:ATP-dependent DNA helicase 2 subunit 1
MGVGWLIARRNQAPVFTAIIPQVEEFDENGAQMTPPGMHCIILPFFDDCRADPVEETLEGPLSWR